jgi:hypothetical protein
MPYKTHEEVMRMHLSNPGVAAEYLIAAVEEGDREDIRRAMNAVLEIHGSGKKYHVKAGGIAAVGSRSKKLLPSVRRTAPKARRAPAKRTRRVAA